MAVLLQRDDEQFVAYLVGPVSKELVPTWKAVGWAIVNAKEIPDPFPGVYQEVVYAATRPNDPRDFRP